MRHLFLTLHEVAFGEVVLGARLATELVAAGDEVIYLAPRAVVPALKGAPVRLGMIDHALRRLDSMLAEVVAETGAQAVCLVDAQSTFASFQHRGLDCGRIFDVSVPLVSIDVWDLAHGGLVVDFAGPGFTLDARVLKIPKLVPVPFARPTADGAYCMLPNAEDLDGARARGRARLGLADGDVAIFMPSAAWQHREAAISLTRPSAQAVPKLLAQYVKALGARLVHVGPWRFPDVDVLGADYIHLRQVPRAEFAELVAASDLLLSLNSAATTIGTALVANLPVLLLHHDATPPAPGPIVTEFLRTAPPIPPFRAWPSGLKKLLSASLADNPFQTAIPSLELFDEAVVLATAGALLRDPATIAAARARMREYVDVVRALPTGRQRYFEALQLAAK